MTTSIQPLVVSGQQLIVGCNPFNIGAMESDKAKFAKRLNEVCDDLQIPPKGKARQTTVAKTFSVSQESARKWTEGESIPKYETILAMAEYFRVNSEWLFSGRGQKNINAPQIEISEDALKIAKSFDMLSEEKKAAYRVLLGEDVERKDNEQCRPGEPQARYVA